MTNEETVVYVRDALREMINGNYQDHDVAALCGLLNQSLPEAKRVKFNTGELRSAFFKPEDA
jgi:hypothetical protein